MALTQNWVGYLDRSFEQIKRSCLSRLGILAPEISDHSESNPLVILLSMFAGIGEMLNLYIDSAAREVYLGTARKYSSAVKIVKLIDYNIKARNSSTADQLFYIVDSTTQEPILLPPGNTIIIPLGTKVRSINGNIPFVLLGEVIIVAGRQNIYGRISQYEQITGAILGSTNGDLNQRFDVSPEYVNGSMQITIAGVEWKLYTTFGLMFPTTKGFLVNIDEDQNAYVEFGDGVNGLIPPVGQTVFANYKISYGKTGNIPPNQITVLETTAVIPAGITLLTKNPDYSVGGSNFETLLDIQNRAPRSIRTLDRAVTYQDYIDLCHLVLGVGAAEVSYCCGKYIDVYVAPNSPGIATQALLQAVQDYLDCRKMITTFPKVYTAGISKIWIKAKIYGQPLRSATDIYNEVVDELDRKYGYATLKINNDISIPGIINTIESLKTVARIEVEKVKILPYARPVNGNPYILNIVYLTLPTTTVKVKYTLIYRASLLKFEVFRDNFYLGLIAIDEVYADAIISFKIETGTYFNSNRWEFTAYQSYPEIFPISLIQIRDFTAAIVEVGPFLEEGTERTIYSDLEIIPQNFTTNCLPTCN